MPPVETVIYFLSILSILGIGFLVFLRNPRDSINLAFFFVVITTVLWLGTLFLYYQVREPDIVLFVGRFNFAIVVLLLYCIFYFSVIFPRKTIVVPSIWKVAALLWSLFFFFVTFLTDSVVREEVITGVNARQSVFGPLHFLYIFDYVLFAALPVFIILYKFRNTENNLERAQLRFFLVGFGSALLWGFVTNLLLPYFGVFWVQNYGPLAPLIFVGFVVYAIFRHYLFNIKIIAAELFTSALFLLSLVRFLLSENTEESVLNGVMLAGVMFFGVLLMRSVYKEVRGREEIQKLAAQLQESNEELKKLDVAKSEFISIASHQLRTPLTVIKGYISMVLEGTFGKLKKELEKPVGLVMASTEDLIQLVNDLLDLSRIESGKIQYTFEPVSLKETVEKVIDMLSEHTRARSIAIVFENKAGDSTKVRGDRYKLHEVVMNLLDNALKYSQKGPITVQLEETEHGDVSYCRLTVRDRGMGIRPEDMPKLFTKFGRSEEAKQIQAGGMGIGLYFVKRVVEDHFGRVWAESGGAGLGSAFYVELPCTIGKER